MGETLALALLLAVAFAPASVVNLSGPLLLGSAVTYTVAGIVTAPAGDRRPRDPR